LKKNLILYDKEGFHAKPFEREKGGGGLDLHRGEVIGFRHSVLGASLTALSFRLTPSFYMKVEPDMRELAGARDILLTEHFT